MNDVMFWSMLLPIFAVVGAFAYSIIRTIAHARVRELEVRERIAMIERGLVPPPEKDPQAFDRAMAGYERYRDLRDRPDWRQRGPGRYRSGGITLIGVGVGIFLLIGFAGRQMDTAMGVGGFMVVLGIAFVINSLLAGRFEAHRQAPPWPVPSQYAQAPPHPQQPQPSQAPQPPQQAAPPYGRE